MNIFLLSLFNLCFAAVPIAIVHYASGGQADWNLFALHFIAFNGVIQGIAIAVRIMERRLFNLKKNLEKEHNIRINL